MLSSVNYAFLGDAVLEVLVRKHLLLKGVCKQDLLQKETVKYVSATAHFNIMKYILEHELFDENELAIFKRGRNHKTKSYRKNLDSNAHQYSTGFEAVIGYHYFHDNEVRILEIFEICKKVIGT